MEKHVLHIRDATHIPAVEGLVEAIDIDSGH
jgi:hypothetical protein